MKDEVKILKKKVEKLENELKSRSYDMIDVFEAFVGGFIVSLLIGSLNHFHNIVYQTSFLKLIFAIIITIIIVVYKVNSISYHHLRPELKKKFEFYIIERTLMIYAVTLIASFTVVLLFHIPNPLVATILLALPGSMGAAIIDLVRNR